MILIEGHITETKKNTVMKPPITKQEILLLTTSSFSKKNFSEVIGDPENIPSPSIAQQLEKACWNGMLMEIIPEIMPETVSGNKLFTWSINEGNAFIYIERAGEPPSFPLGKSVNPYLFYSLLNFN